MADQKPPMKPKGGKMTIRDIINELVERSNSNMRRLRVLEQDSDAMKTRVKAAEDSVKETKKSVVDEAKELEDTVNDNSERIVKIENVLKDVVDRLKKAVTTGKIKELEELLDIYSPLKSQFITKEELERILEERMGSK